MPRINALKRNCLILALLALPALGCSTMRDATATPRTIDRLAALDFPEDAPHGPDLNVQLVRSGNQLRLVNLTANNYAGMQLWLNREWVADSGTVLIGTDNLRKLTDFINRFEEPYPVGNWLNPNKTRRLVHAEFYDPDKKIRHRLLVRPDDASSIIPFEDLDR